ncbi:MAG: S1/P1 nuclease [Gemmatimonadales bacterium]
MIQMRRVASLVAAGPLLFGPPRVQVHAVPRWGPLGHRVVAEVAMARIAPAVADETRRLLGGQTLADVASWADDVRREQPNTASWHYVDIQVVDSAYVASRDCKENGCIVAALQTQIAILSDRARSDADRAIALKWVVHLVGDIHQPLHAGERGDRGGNDVKVTFNGRSTNLHALWDSGLLLSYGQTEEDLVHEILTAIAPRHDLARLTATTPVQWANESHDIARDFVYRDLPASLDITPEYAAAARPIIQAQLLRAGVRLAAVLDTALRK